MNTRSPHRVFAATALLLALQCAIAADAGTTAQRSTTADTQVATVVTLAVPAPKHEADVPAVAPVGDAAPARPISMGWGFTPRRPLQGRRR